MKIYGKRGFEVSLKFIIMWIVLPIIAGLFILMIFVQVGGKASGGFGDDLCHMNAGFKNMLWTGLKVVLPLFACKERSVKVDANDFSKCDPGDALGYKGANDLKSCASEQLFGLINRCWYMMGSGNFNFVATADEYNCFAAKIKDLGTDTISETDFVNFMKTHIVNGKSYCSIIGDNSVGGSAVACGNSDRIRWGGAIKSQITVYVDFSDANLPGQADSVRVYYSGSGLIA